jgi:hypothetical protein
MPLWLTIAAVAATIVIGAFLMGWQASRSPRNRKAFAVASALFLAFGVYNPNQDRIVETREEGEHAKRQKAGDPPEPDTEDPPP